MTVDHAVSHEEASPIQDISIAAAGQGGDGSLTLTTLIGRAFARLGYHIYESRNVASRIKGGHAAAYLRAGEKRVRTHGSRLDLMIAFDHEAMSALGDRISRNGVVIFDNSTGDCPRELLSESAMVLEVPFGKFAVRKLRKDLYKNSFAFGICCAVLGIEQKLAFGVLRKVYGRLSENIVVANIEAVDAGFQYALENVCAHSKSLWRPMALPQARRHHMSGNDALAFGFLAAGGRFFSGYPITPATDIMEWLGRYLPSFGGVVLQAEDELAAVNMAIGAAQTGVRAMTASSGPGIALMAEGVGQAGAAEIPLVIVNCQRAGPSTGMPTKPEQSDVCMMALGGNGDFPRVVLAPADPEECFEIGAQAANLAEVGQMPVYIALDQVVGQNKSTFPSLPVDQVRIDRGKRLDQDTMPPGDSYKRYRFRRDGISEYTVPGTPGGMSLVTGNERSEWGHVVTDRINRTRMMDKRAKKLETIAPQLPRAIEWGHLDATIGMIGVGMQRGVLHELSEMPEVREQPLAFHSPLTIWPVLTDTLGFMETKHRVIVVEHSREAQLSRLLRSCLSREITVYSIARYDGVPFTASELLERLRNLGIGV